ncbi:hypothetical protein FACS189491_11500 [Spirochaetia bacterium]|nr:hypothetical protein FACS189491_11500 [Spirochaetia bacterium]
MIFADCPRCEAQGDFSPEGIAAMAAGIHIDPALQAGQGVYEKRIAACSCCDALRNGVFCAHCGCFIQFRARSKKSYCPHPAGDKWPAE